MLAELKQNITIHPENCAQCLSCLLICSFINLKTFNPTGANLDIKPGHFEEGTWVPTEIKFKETCKPNCWLCAKYCAYEALEHVGDVK